MLRHLTERVPFMIAPRWVDTQCQPIGIRSVLEYLIEALERSGANGIYEIGGPEVLTYREMILTYARLRGLRRVVWTMDVPRPEWSSRFLSIVTPIPHVIAAPLVESLQYEMTVKDERARIRFDVTPMGFTESVSLALDRLAADEVETTWASSLASMSHIQMQQRELAEHDGMLFERHRLVSVAFPARVFAYAARSAATRAGRRGTGCGNCAGSSTARWAAWGRAEGDGTLAHCSSVSRSTSGALRR